MKSEAMKAVLVIGAVMLLAACGGGSSSDGGATTSAPQGTTISGTVTAPNGQLAKAKIGMLQWIASLFVTESHAQGAPDFVGVPNINVLAFVIDNKGNPISNASGSTVLAKTITKADGTFSLTLPSGASLGSNIIIQATSGNAPSRVCDPTMSGCPQGQTTLNAPAVNTSLTLNPAVEIATRQILLRIAQAGASGTLANYTNAEVLAFMDLARSRVANDPSVIGSNLADTYTNILAALQTIISDVLPGLETPGQVDPSAATYWVGGLHTNLSWLTGSNYAAGDVERAINSGALVLNANGTFSLAVDFKGLQLKEACQSSCQRTFTNVPIDKEGRDGGTYIRTTNHRLILTSPDGSTTIAYLNPTETFLMTPFDDFSGFAVGLKLGSGVPTSTLSHQVLNYSMLHLGLTDNLTQTSPWPGPIQGEIQSGTLSFTDASVSVAATGSLMSQRFTCSKPIFGPCTISTLSAELLASPSNDTFVASYAVSPDGAVTVSNIPGGGTEYGQTSGDYFFVPIREADGASMVLGMKGSGADTRSIAGTYKIVTFGETLHPDFGDQVLFGDEGTMTFNYVDGCNPEGPICTVTISGAGKNRIRSSFCPLSTDMGYCSFRFSTEPQTWGISGQSYTASDGKLSIDSPFMGPTPMQGFISPDGSVIVFTNSFDNWAYLGGPALSQRMIAIAVKNAQ